MGTMISTFLERLSPELQEQALEVVPNDPEVRIGTLANGLTYYLRKHHKPENRALFRFVMHVGSLMEDEDQRGLAHILEHMAFNGSTHFAPQELDAYFQSIGMQFGAHVNASTGFDQTIYKLEIPTEDDSIFVETFKVLRDWGDGLSLLPEQIEKERKVGLEEWRGRLSGRTRAMEQIIKTQFWGSKHIERLPIGTEESLKTFEHESLKRFYRDWYRPDLCSVVIVGDIDVEQIEGLLETYLADWKSDSTRPKEKSTLPIHRERLLDVIQDPTIPFPMLMMSQKKPLIQQVTQGGWAWHILKHELMVTAINERFQFLHRSVDSQVQSAKVSRQGITPDCEMETLQVVLDAKEWKASIDEIQLQCKQLRSFGLTQSELDRVKERRLSMVKMFMDNLPTIQSQMHMRDIMDTVLDNEPMWPQHRMMEMMERWLPEITLEDVNAHLQNWLTGEGLVIHFLTPEDCYTVNDLEEWLNATNFTLMEPYVEEETAGTLLEEPLPAGTLQSESINAELDIREWTFDNGVKVWLKQTDFEENMIHWSGLAPGGLSIFEDEDRVGSKMVTSLLSLADVGPHSVEDVIRLMNAVQGGFQWSLSEKGQSVSGRASREGLLPILQLFWLQSQQAQISETNVEKLHKVLKTRLSNDDSPEQIFGRRKRGILYNHHPRTRPLELEDIPSITLTRGQIAYEKLIQPAGAMHYAVVGNFDWADMNAILSETIGALPPVEEPIEFQDRQVRKVEGQGRHEIAVFDEPKAAVELNYISTMDCDREDRLYAQVISYILEERFRKSLREKEAGTYHVMVDWEYDLRGKQIHQMIAFGCDPERVEELEAKATAVLQEFIAEGITQLEMDLEIGKVLRAYEQHVKKNGYWLNVMKRAIRNHRELEDIRNTVTAIQELTLEELNLRRGRLYQMESYCHFVGLPKVQDEV